MYKPGMFIGAVVNPNFQTLDLQLIRMRKKVEAGAQFFQTQDICKRAWPSTVDGCLAMGHVLSYRRHDLEHASLCC
jgi:hypothetical protein